MPAEYCMAVIPASFNPLTLFSLVRLRFDLSKIHNPTPLLQYTLFAATATASAVFHERWSRHVPMGIWLVTNDELKMKKNTMMKRFIFEFLCKNTTKPVKEVILIRFQVLIVLSSFGKYCLVLLCRK